jgi:hypothetical protein
MDEFDKRRLVDWCVAYIAQLTGRRYRIQFDLLDAESLREVQRLLRDVDHEKHQAVQQARLWPWRR